MNFLYPQFFLLLVPLLVLVYFTATKSSVYERYFSKEVLKTLVVKGDMLGQKGRDMFMTIALVFFIFALSRPISHQKEIQIQRGQNSLLVALDISRSMQVKDVAPERFDFAKKSLIWLSKNLPNTNIGVILFAKDTYLLSPITSDKKSLRFLLDRLDLSMANKHGSDIENMLHEAQKLFGKRDFKNILIFGDGGENIDIKSVLKGVKSGGLSVNVISVGTDEGGVLETKNGVLKDKNGNIFVSKRNDDLEILSKKTGGVYVKELGSGDGVRVFRKSLVKKYDKSKKTIKIKKEWFMIPFSMGIFCIFIAFLGLPKRRFFVTVFLLFTPLLHGGAFDFWYIKKANGYIQTKNYKMAIREYEKLKPNANIHFNKANAYYKMGNFSKAIDEYKRVKTDDKNLKANTLYNLANSHVQQKRYKKSLKLYFQALKLTPNDEDIKTNIKIVEKMLLQKRKIALKQEILKSKVKRDLENEEDSLENRLQKKYPKIHPMRLGREYKGDENGILW